MNLIPEESGMLMDKVITDFKVKVWAIFAQIMVATSLMQERETDHHGNNIMSVGRLQSMNGNLNHTKHNDPLK